MNQQNLKRFGIHVALGAALTAVGLVIENIGRFNLTPTEAAIAGLLLGSLASFLRKEQAATDDVPAA